MTIVLHCLCEMDRMNRCIWCIGLLIIISKPGWNLILSCSDQSHCTVCMQLTTQTIIVWLSCWKARAYAVLAGWTRRWTNSWACWTSKFCIRCTEFFFFITYRLLCNRSFIFFLNTKIHVFHILPLLLPKKYIHFSYRMWRRWIFVLYNSLKWNVKSSLLFTMFIPILKACWLRLADCWLMLQHGHLSWSACEGTSLSPPWADFPPFPVLSVRKESFIQWSFSVWAAELQWKFLSHQKIKWTHWFAVL